MQSERQREERDRTEPQPRAAALAWARHVAERYGSRRLDGKVVVPYSQAELLRLDGCSPNDGRVSRYLRELGPLVTKERGHLVIDLEHLPAARRRPAYLRALPPVTDAPSRATDRTAAAGRDDATALARRIAELEAALEVKDQLIAALLAERALGSSPSASRGEPRERAGGRARSPEVSSVSEGITIDDGVAQLDFASASDSARSRVEARERAESAGAETDLDWEPSELAALVAELAAACEQRALPGITSQRGLLDALRTTRRGRDAVVFAQRKLARQLRAGEALRSPFGMLVRAAREGWPEYFPAPRALRAAEPAVSREELVDEADQAVSELEASDDPYLATLDEVIADWRASTPGPLRARLERHDDATPEGRHHARVAAWRYLAEQA